MPHMAVDDEEWNKILARQLFTPSEMEIVRSYKGFKPFLVIYWALEEAKVRVSVYG